MPKIRTTITIDEDLLQLAKKHNIKISTYLNNSLTDYLLLSESENAAFTRRRSPVRSRLSPLTV